MPTEVEKALAARFTKGAARPTSAPAPSPEPAFRARQPRSWMCRSPGGFKALSTASVEPRSPEGEAKTRDLAAFERSCSKA